MSKKYTCILFDLDGTLLDTIGDIKYNINLTMRSLGFPEHTYDKTRTFINYGAYRLIECALPEGHKAEAEVKAVLEMYLANYDKNVCNETTAYEGIVQLVKRLKDEGYVLGVVSNKPERHVIMLCEIFFGKGTFSYISGTGENKPVKPSKECVELALKAMGQTSENLLYVGDSFVDVLTAHNSSVPCVGVTWGFHGKGGFNDQAPDFYVDNTDELYDLISGNFKG